MSKTAIGKYKDKTLIEGDENLMEYNEILIQEDEDFKLVFKERTETGEVNTYVLVPVEDYIEDLEGAYAEGVNSINNEHTEEGK